MESIYGGIFVVREETSEDETNRALREGWLLLSAGPFSFYSDLHKTIMHGVKYVLGMKKLD